MNDKLNNICKIEYASLRDVSDFAYLPGELIFMNATWTDLEFVPGANLRIDEKHGKPGTRYDTDFSCRLLDKFLKSGLYIFRLYFSDQEKAMIIGSPDLPIKLEESHQLDGKQLSFSHSSWHYPYEVTVATGSGSGGGGV